MAQAILTNGELVKPVARISWISLKEKAPRLLLCFWLSCFIPLSHSVSTLTDMTFVKLVVSLFFTLSFLFLPFSTFSLIVFYFSVPCEFLFFSSILLDSFHFDLVSFCFSASNSIKFVLHRFIVMLRLTCYTVGKRFGVAQCRVNQKDVYRRWDKKKTDRLCSL